MIKLNTEHICVEANGSNFDIKKRLSGELVGRISSSQNMVLHLEFCSEAFIQEAVLSISQYLMCGTEACAVDVSQVPYLLGFANTSGLVTRESIQVFSNNMRTVRIAAVVLQNTDGAMLLGKRPQGADMAGVWEFPGGKIETNETPQAAAHREISEELGVDIISSTEVMLFGHCFLKNWLEGHVWLSREWHGTPQEIHHSNLEWVKPNDLHLYDMPISNILALPKILETIEKITH